MEHSKSLIFTRRLTLSAMGFISYTDTPMVVGTCRYVRAVSLKKGAYVQQVWQFYSNLTFIAPFIFDQIEDWSKNMSRPPIVNGPILYRTLFSNSDISSKVLFCTAYGKDGVLLNHDHGKWPKNGNFHVSFQYSLYSKDFFVWDWV